MKTKQFFIFISIIAIVLSLCGCNESTAVQQEQTTAPTQTVNVQHPYGGHADIRINGGKLLDPLNQTGYQNYQWTTMVFENALTRDLDDNIQPGVCNYSLSDDSRTLTLWVRDGVRFHNGDTVDIYDVEASFQRSFDMFKSITTKVVPFVKSMTVDPDANTLTLVFSQYREDVFYYLASYRTWCPIMPKEICEKFASSTITSDVKDCIGTGPYMVTEFKSYNYIKLARFEDYAVQQSDLTGFAGPKYAYLDTVTFWHEPNDNTAVKKFMAGEYDCVDCMSNEFDSQLGANGINTTVCGTYNGWFVYFNTYGRKNITAKYPSLRKAVMAAIDTEQLLSVLSNGQYTTTNTPIMSSEYDTEIFSQADYMGPANSELAAAYAEQAKAEGWNGTDPIYFVPFSEYLEAENLIMDSLRNAGIPVMLVESEAAKQTAWRRDINNNWDFYVHNAVFASTPTLTQDVIINTYWKSVDKDTLLVKMKTLHPQDEAYMQKWQELAQLWVDDCAVAYLGIENGTYYHPETFHTNEDPGTAQRYWFNAYWDDPENHTQ